VSCIPIAVHDCPPLTPVVPIMPIRQNTVKAMWVCFTCTVFFSHLRAVADCDHHRCFVTCMQAAGSARAARCLMHIKKTPPRTHIHCVGNRILVWVGTACERRQRDNLILASIWLTICSSTGNRCTQLIIRQNVSDALPWFITAVVLAANHFRESSVQHTAAG
jgi:hypothetical protein